VGVSAHGVDPVGAGQACIGYLSLPLGDKALAHLHVNWLSPTKVRTMIIGGSERMVVWDDLQPSQRLTIYDTGVDLTETPEDRQRAMQIAYRTGNIVAPALQEREALQGVADEFCTSIRTGATPATDGASGLRVLAMLEAARASLADRGAFTTATGRRKAVAA
jgi:predicted dehydrogenase